MSDLKGFVQYRFHSDEHDADIIIRGDADWVRAKISELELDGVGWMMPVGREVVASNTSGIKSKSASKADISIDDSPLSDKPLDMGPEPDPSRIPVIRRPIGELDLAAKLVEVGLEQPVRPTADQLREQLQDIEEPQPAQGPMVKDPMAEAWLKELLRIAVRNHGVTAITTETIALAASDYLGDREGMELELFLEAMFRSGKLVKVHGGDNTGWGPSPAWLASGL